MAEQKHVLDQICLEDNQLIQHTWEHAECTGKRCAECGKVEGELRTVHMFLDGHCVNCGRPARVTGC